MLSGPLDPYDMSGSYFRPPGGYAPSHKEEVARAALRSLASPSLSGPPLPPTGFSDRNGRPLPLPNMAFYPAVTSGAGYSTRATQRSAQTDPFGIASGHYDRDSVLDQRMEVDEPMAPPRGRSVSAQKTPVFGSYFGLPSLTASPTTSPRLESAVLTAEPEHLPTDPPSLSISSTASTPNYEIAGPAHEFERTLQRVAATLRLSCDEVRSVAEQAYPQLASTGSGALSRGMSAAQMDPSIVRLIMDALDAEARRSAKMDAFRDSYAQRSRTCEQQGDSSRPAPPPGQMWASDRTAYERRGGPRQRHTHNNIGGGISDPWDERAHHGSNAGPSFSTTAVSSRESYRSILAGSASPRSSVGGDAVLSASPRSSSPSPFAFDPLRRPSLPPISAMTLNESAASPSLDPIGTGSPRQRWFGGERGETVASPGLPYRSGFNAARKGRSIDDYLESSANRRVRRPSRPRDVLTMLPSELEVGAAPASSRHPYQPYPSASSRHNPLQLTQTQSWSPSTSPALKASPMHYVSGLPRRSNPSIGGPSSYKGPAAPSSGAGLAVSPVISSNEQSLWESQSAQSESSDTLAGRSDGTGSSRLAPARDRSVDSLRDSRHARIEPAPSKAAAATKKPRGRAVRARTSVASGSPAAVPTSEASPAPSAGLTREEIMQRLQNKVKARIAAKQGHPPDSSSSATDGAVGLDVNSTRPPPKKLGSASTKAKAAKIGKSTASSKA